MHPQSEVVNNFRFPGQYFDEETGFHYNYHRYYDPRTGRYLRADPIGFMGGDLNLYVYVSDNPFNAVDPLGLEIILKGSTEERDLLRKYLSRIAGTDIEIDCEGNVLSNFSSPSEFSLIEKWLKEIIISPYSVSVEFGVCQFGIAGCFKTLSGGGAVARIDPRLKVPNQRKLGFNPKGLLDSIEFYRPEGALAHELLGHGLDYVRTIPKGYTVDDNTSAIRRANIVRALLSIPQREN